MKKIFAMAVALIAAVSVNAQDLTDNYQKVYAGFTTYNLNDDWSGMKDFTTKGFQVGYAYAFNITGHNVPLFLEVGAEFNYGSTKITRPDALVPSEDIDITMKAGNVAVPVNITYKFGNENFTVAPFVGEALRIWTNMSFDNDENVYSVFDESDMKKGWNTSTTFNRVQAVFNAGVNFTIKQHLLIGYRFQMSTTSIEPKLEINGITILNEKSDMAHSLSVGYVF